MILRVLFRARFFALLPAVFISFAGCQFTPQAEAIRHPEKQASPAPTTDRPATHAYGEICKERIEKEWQALVRHSKKAQEELAREPMQATFFILADGKIEQLEIHSVEGSESSGAEYQRRAFDNAVLPPMPPDVVRETGGRLRVSMWLHVSQYLQ